MLWACLHFPALALNLVEQGLPRPQPSVVEITRKNQRLVLHANSLALQAGVIPGMTIPTAQGLVNELHCQVYDQRAESKALQQLANWAYEFTPHIQTHGSHSLLLEVSHSLKLFQGQHALAQRLLQRLPPGFEPFALTFCETPMAALLFAQAHEGCNRALFFSLQDLPDYDVQWLSIPAAQKALLYSMGLKTLSQLTELPRDTLSKRFGIEFSGYLNRLLGQQADPLPNWVLPEQFSAELEFVQEIESSQALLFPIRHLLSRLEHYLTARQLSLNHLLFSLALRNRSRQSWHMHFAAPVHRLSDMLPLVQLKLENLKLQAPVLNLQLSAQQFLPLNTTQGDLFSQHQNNGVSRYQLVDRLKARLGDKQVHGLGMVADHRPEYSWSSATPGQGEVLQHPAEQRPFWLLTHPQKLRSKKGLPLYDHPLQLLKGPERIETGWWDNKPINRDYFIALHGNGQRFWVYRDRDNQHWFLHGIFSA
ncbi:DNA polymerase Y family protein [Ketobacter sp. MCCC 1A13808]|uniref:Y-family DNA polymerase n=1 Tax=Ketobacter sp. MCCC 1A13808 TaxID=2602738 RepID=UPI000F272DCE|nr:DNA polymerase Y family protein [Ketobacter sp. MCCC 1A13808]MVF14444.1 DNA polymerase Y family protein [Ketobacter sp. MCCC 1A13808]RLP52764.1 MAG: DNA polymerase Y family protein [Ketobacter sp.]